MMNQLDLTTDVFERTEAALNAWAFQCRELSHRMGLPTSSNGIVRMIEQVRAHEGKRKDVKVRRVARRTAHRNAPRKCEFGHIFCGPYCPKCADSKAVAIALGFAERTPTALGKQTPSFERPSLELAGEVARIDRIVRNLAGWMKAAIFRSYLYGQPDRIAARELKMPRAEFTSRRRAAVIMVAEKLAQHRASR